MKILYRLHIKINKCKLKFETESYYDLEKEIKHWFSIYGVTYFEIEVFPSEEKEK